MVVILIVSILAAVAIPLMRSKIDSSKWSEGKAIMGTIAMGIRTYAAENGGLGSYGDNRPSMTDLGFDDSDFTGTYFTESNFSWVTSFSYTADPVLTFTITTDNEDTGITTPSQITLNHTGKWVETP